MKIESLRLEFRKTYSIKKKGRLIDLEKRNKDESKLQIWWREKQTWEVRLDQRAKQSNTYIDLEIKKDRSKKRGLERRRRIHFVFF